MTTANRNHNVIDQYDIDPITFEVLRSAYTNISREMGETMMRTAYSSIFNEGRDFSCGILGVDGEMIAQAEHCPVHLGSMPYTAEWALDEIGIDTIEPGDVLLQNDPFRRGTHLPDFLIMKAVAVDDDLLAFPATRAHVIDVGGAAPGGFSGTASNIYEEGLRMPPVRWFKAGEEDEEITKILMSNVRLNDVQRGDYEAMLASLNTAERRLEELVEEYGRETISESFDAVKNVSEEMMRLELEDIPDGTYEFEDFMDDDGHTTDPIRIAVEIEIEGDSATVDYSDSDPQTKGPINATFGITASSTYNGFLQVTDRDVPANHGAFRPIDITAPEGTIVNAEPPAPTFSGNTETSVRIVDTVLGALMAAIPDEVPAGCYGHNANLTSGGVDPETDEEYVWYYYRGGGYGGMQTKDGYTAVQAYISNASNQPVEIFETKYPWMIEEYNLNDDEEAVGAGRHRGGLGTKLRLRLRRGEATISGTGDRCVIPPYGVFGGSHGGRSHYKIKRSDEDELRSVTEHGSVSPTKFGNIPMDEGDVVEVATGGGGGYGDPLERDPEAVLHDVENGYISRESAKSDYGVVLTEESGDLSVDVAATNAQREDIRESRAPLSDLDRGISE
jgi:N-methylhydantoinase B/oxoprolinase/acetone carboxylase alpha subunit